MGNERDGWEKRWVGAGGVRGGRMEGNVLETGGGV